MRKAVRAKKAVNVRMFSADAVFAAACAAQRINGEYLKFSDFNTETEITRRPNKELLRSILIEPEFEAVVTDADRKQADEIRNYFRCKLMDVLAGTASDFLRNAVDLASRDEIAANDWLNLAIISSLPQSYVRSIERDAAKMQKDEAMSVSQHFGNVGDKVTGKATVIDSRYSQNWGVYFVTAKFGTKVILFSYRNTLEAGAEVEFKGTVKAHRENFVTQLNRVKLI